MKLPVKVNGAFHDAEIKYATEPDFGFLQEWRRCLGTDRHPVRADALDFAALACKRFRAHFSIENYAQQTEDIPDYTRNNPNAEVAGLVLMRCDWFPESGTIGLAHFRRSWCNNLILDYLVAHPWIASKPPHYDRKVSGVGVGLLYFLGEVMSVCSCGSLWGEATQNSCEFYKTVFSLDSVQDLLYIPKENMAGFAAAMKAKWSANGIKL